MKNHVDSNLLLGFLVGATVGVAVGYLAATDKREEVLNEMNHLVGKMKDGFHTAVNKYKEAKAEYIDKASKAPAEAEAGE